MVSFLLSGPYVFCAESTNDTTKLNPSISLALDAGVGSSGKVAALPTADGVLNTSADMLLLTVTVGEACLACGGACLHGIMCW